MRRANIIRMLQKADVPEAPRAISQIKEPEANRDADKENVAAKTLPKSISGINDTNEQAQTGESKKPVEEEDEIEMLDKWDPMAEDYYSPTNTLVLNPEKDPECVITGRMIDDTISIGRHKVCTFYLKHGTCADGNYCNRLHIRPSARDKIHSLQREHEMNTSKTRLVSHYLSPIELTPNNDTLLLASITMVTSPTKFYFVVPYERMNFAVLDQSEVDFYVDRVANTSSLKTKLQKCHEQLAMLFDHNYRTDNVQDMLCIGQIVACKREDGRFCRASVISYEYVELDMYYKLFLIDIGIEVLLPREAIYEIRANILSEPPLAVLGRLGLKPAQGESQWSEEAVTQFGEFVAKRSYLLCKILDHFRQDDIFTVDLIDLVDRTSITKLMLDNKLAERSML